MQLYTSTRTWYSGPHCPCESGILFFQRQVLTDGLSLWFNNSACENWIGQFPPLWVLKDGWFSLPGCFVAVSFFHHIIFIYFFIDFCQTDYLKIFQTYLWTTEHTCGPTLQADHIRLSSIFCCGSHSMEQFSCRIQRPDNQRCLLLTAFKDSSVRTTASAP